MQYDYYRMWSLAGRQTEFAKLRRIAAIGDALTAAALQLFMSE